ncbi:MAG: STAS domain-containing protein [Actinomycetota bacterium]|nr:STAS domain-containing protein [Actinomycetota bacterium]
MIFTRNEGTDGRRQATLVLAGEIDLATAPALRQVAGNLQLRDLDRLTVDMHDVQFMDSTGVGFLVSLRKQLPAGSELAVVHAAPMIVRVLQLTGLGSVLELDRHPEQETAAAGIGLPAHG